MQYWHHWVHWHLLLQVFKLVLYSDPESGKQNGHQHHSSISNSSNTLQLRQIAPRMVSHFCFQPQSQKTNLAQQLCCWVKVHQWRMHFRYQRWFRRLQRKETWCHCLSRRWRVKGNGALEGRKWRRKVRKVCQRFVNGRTLHGRKPDRRGEADFQSIRKEGFAGVSATDCLFFSGHILHWQISVLRADFSIKTYRNNSWSQVLSTCPSHSLSPQICLGSSRSPDPSASTQKRTMWLSVSFVGDPCSSNSSDSSVARSLRQCLKWNKWPTLAPLSLRLLHPTVFCWCPCSVWIKKILITSPSTLQIGGLETEESAS